MRMLAGYPIKKHSHDYAASPVDSSAWVEVITAMDMPCSAIEIFSAAGATLKMSLGDAGDEDAHEIPYYILPGGSGIMLPINIAKGKRISVKSIDIDADAGSLVLNFFG